jgi:ribosomal protein S12 methylthiotransferase accessory factor
MPYLLSGIVRDVPLRDTSDDGTDLERSLDDLSERLSNRGVAYFVCDLTPRASLIDVAATIAPGLERFSLVRLDVPVIPTGRGWPIWRRSVPTTAPRAD